MRSTKSTRSIRSRPFRDWIRLFVFPPLEVAGYTHSRLWRCNDQRPKYGDPTRHPCGETKWPAQASNRSKNTSSPNLRRRRKPSSVRTAIHQALPQAEEVISYDIPAFKLRGRVVLYFAGWKEHYSLYPAGPRLVAAFKEELAAHELSKGTIRFPLSKPVPVRLIARIAKFKAKEFAEKENVRTQSARKH